VVPLRFNFDTLRLNIFNGRHFPNGGPGSRVELGGRKHLDPSVTCGKCSILPITSQIDMSLVDWLGNLQSESSFTVMALNTFKCDGITPAIGWVYIMK